MEEERIHPRPARKKQISSRPALPPVPESPGMTFSNETMLEVDSVVSSSTESKAPAYERPTEPHPSFDESLPRGPPPERPVYSLTLPERPTSANKRMSLQKRNSMEIPRVESKDLRNQSSPRNRAQSLDNPNPFAPIPNLSTFRLLDDAYDDISREKKENQLRETEKDFARLKFHHGPIDQKALSGSSPERLMQNIHIVMKEMRLQVIPTPDPFKLKIVKNPVEEDDIIELQSKKKTKRNLGYLITHFPLEIMNRIKYMSKFGLQYNRGFDGSKLQIPTQPPAKLEEPIKMYIMVHKVRNLDGLLTVDLKRSRGDIWEFKRLYQEIIQRLNLGIAKE
jgi:hypothetical protein